MGINNFVQNFGYILGWEEQNESAEMSSDAGLHFSWEEGDDVDVKRTIRSQGDDTNVYLLLL